MALGISYNNVDKSSFLGLVRDFIQFPLTSDTDYLSAASVDGGAQAVKDISASVVGDSVMRSAQGARPLMFARCPLLTVVDNLGTSLSVTVRIVGRRFGRRVVQDITATGVSTAVSGTRVIDEVVSMSIIAISNNTTSDTLSVGIDDSWLGLMCPIRTYKDIRMIQKVATTTPNSTGARYSTDITSAMVRPKDSAIDMKTLFSAALATTDSYTVEYEASAAGVETFDRKGLRFN